MTTQITINDSKPGKISKISLLLNVILIAALVISWITRPKILEPEIVERVETIVETDTIYVDRIIREVELVMDTVIVHRDLSLPSDIVDSLPPLVTYYQSFADSLISGHLVAMVRGELIDQRLFYKHLKPQIIIKTVTTIQTVTNRIIIEQSFLQAGLDVGIVGEGLQINPMIGYSHRSGYSMYYRYSPWENGGHSIGFLTPIKIPWLNL